MARRQMEEGKAEAEAKCKTLENWREMLESEVAHLQHSLDNAVRG